MSAPDDKLFNEESLRKAIVAIWGPSGAHAEVFDDMAYRIATLEARVRSLQAKIGALMLEYCPGEMTPEQFDEWAANQRPAALNPRVPHE